MHIAASVGYFIEYIVLHGTMNIKNLKMNVTGLLAITAFGKLDLKKKKKIFKHFFVFC